MLPASTMVLSAGGSVQLINETLDSVVSPAVRDVLVCEALTRSALVEVPTDPESFREFVAGPLRGALVDGLGSDLAETVLEELERVAIMVDLKEPSSRSSTRRSTRPRRSHSPPPRRNTPTHRRSTPPFRKEPTQPSFPHPEAASGSSLSGGWQSIPTDPNAPTMPPPASSGTLGRVALTPPPNSGLVEKPALQWGTDERVGLSDALVGGFQGLALEAGRPYVLVASTDPNLLRRLTPWLEGAAEILRVSGVRELVRDLDALGSAPIALIVDCRMASIRPTAVAAFADELPSNVSVVLWGASPDQESAVLAITPAVNRWLVLRPDIRPKELARHCVDLVG